MGSSGKSEQKKANRLAQRQMEATIQYQNEQLEMARQQLEFNRQSTARQQHIAQQQANNQKELIAEQKAALQAAQAEKEQAAADEAAAEAEQKKKLRMRGVALRGSLGATLSDAAESGKDFFAGSVLGAANIGKKRLLSA